MSLQAAVSGLPRPAVSSALRLSKGVPMCTFADQLMIAVPVAVAVGAGTYLLTRYFSSRRSEGKVNLEINKDSSKVVHSFDIEDIDKKAVYCRCWRSKKFPYCDGAHNKHNEETGDNVGPLIIKKRDA